MTDTRGPDHVDIRPAPKRCAQHQMTGCPVCLDVRVRSALPADVTPLIIAEPEAMGAGEGAHGHDAPPAHATGQGNEGLSSTASPSSVVRAREAGPYFATEGDGMKATLAGVAMRLAGGNHRVCWVPEHSIATAQQIADALNMLHSVRAGTAGKGAATPLEERAIGLEEIEPGRRFRLKHGETVIDLIALSSFEELDGLARQRFEAMERAAAERDAAEAALQVIADHHGDVLPRGAVLDAIAKVRGDYGLVEQWHALDNLAAVVSDLPGIGSPELPEPPEPGPLHQDPGQAGAAMAGHLRGGGIDLAGVTSRPQAERTARLFFRDDLASARAAAHDLPAAHPVDVLEGMAHRMGFEPDPDRMAKLREICDAAASDGPFTAGAMYEQGDIAPVPIGAAVFSGDGMPYCLIEPDTVVGGSTDSCIARAERIRDALNAVDEMTCEHCHDLGHSHAPDCPANDREERQGRITFADLAGWSVPVTWQGNVRVNLHSIALAIIEETSRRACRSPTLFGK